MSSQVLSRTNQETSTRAHRSPTSLHAEERLGKSGYRALRDVSCIASDGVLYLDGCLPSHYLKQVAQEVVAGVCHVINRIIVSAPARRMRPAPETFVNPPAGRGRYLMSGEDRLPRTCQRREEFATMLVLSRRRNEVIVIDGNIRVTVVDIQGNQVRLGIEAPKSVSIFREELGNRTESSVTYAKVESAGAAS